MNLITGQFNDSFPPVMDGVANVTKNYAYWLNRKYGKSYVVTPSFPNYQDDEEFEVIRYVSAPFPLRPPFRAGLPRLDRHLGPTLDAIPFDLVHAHCPFSAGQLALRIARKRGIPIIATFHSKYYDDIKATVKAESLAEFGIKKIVSFFEAVDSVWTVNQSTAATLRDYGYHGPIEIVPNGTDFTPPADLETARKRAEKFWGLAPGETMLLFTGQHIWQKNCRMLIQSLERIKQNGLKFKMVFAGDGYARQEMEQLTKELGLVEYVRFLGVILDRDLLQALFARANLFLFPSLYDNAPIVVREAAAMGCPAVLIAGSNSAEEVTDGFNGWLAPNDPDEYAAKVILALGDREKLLQVGQNSQKTIFKDWEQLIDQVQLRYEDIVKSYRRSAHQAYKTRKRTVRFS